MLYEMGSICIMLYEMGSICIMLYEMEEKGLLASRWERSDSGPDRPVCVVTADELSAEERADTICEEDCSSMMR
jgi:DNA-binding PadR family transcriptional regulator